MRLWDLRALASNQTVLEWPAPLKAARQHDPALHHRALRQNKEWNHVSLLPSLFLEREWPFSLLLNLSEVEAPEEVAFEFSPSELGRPSLAIRGPVLEAESATGRACRHGDSLATGRF